MSKNRSFRPSDFTFRDIPVFIVIYIILSVLSVGFGLLVEQLPDMFRGILIGLAIGLVISLVIFRPSKTKSED